MKFFEEHILFKLILDIVTGMHGSTWEQHVCALAGHPFENDTIEW